MRQMKVMYRRRRAGRMVEGVGRASESEALVVLHRLASGRLIIAKWNGQRRPGRR